MIRVTICIKGLTTSIAINDDGTRSINDVLNLEDVDRSEFAILDELLLDLRDHVRVATFDPNGETVSLDQLIAEIAASEAENSK